MSVLNGLIAFVIIIALYCNLSTFVHGVDMDVKCTVYEHSDDVNGNNVDVRILVLGLKPNYDYTAHVIPDHNIPMTVMTKTDFDGIFWVVAKIPNGEKSTLFNVKVYEGNNIEGKLVASGDDDAPCYVIPAPSSRSSSSAASSQ